MKTTTLVLGIMVILASCVLPVVQGGYGPAPGRATFMGTETCKLCHIDYIPIHHTTEIDCVDCHSEPSFILDCTVCHPGFDHHEDAQRRCSDCHEDTQRRGRR